MIARIRISAHFHALFLRDLNTFLRLVHFLVQFLETGLAQALRRTNRRCATASTLCLFAELDTDDFSGIQHPKYTFQIHAAQFRDALRVELGVFVDKATYPLVIAFFIFDTLNTYKSGRFIE